MHSTRRRKPAATAAIGTPARRKSRSPNGRAEVACRRPAELPPSTARPSKQQPAPIGGNVHSNAEAARDRKPSLRRSVFGLYLKIEEYDIINRKYGSPIARQMVERPCPAFEKASRNGRHGQTRKRRIRRHVAGQHAGRSKPGRQTDACGHRQLRAAARRSRTADPLAARRRRAQTERNRARTLRPGATSLRRRPAPRTANA